MMDKKVFKPFVNEQVIEGYGESARVPREQKNEIAIYHYKLALSLDSTIVEARQGLKRLEK